MTTINVTLVITYLKKMKNKMAYVVLYKYMY